MTSTSVPSALAPNDENRVQAMKIDDGKTVEGVLDRYEGLKKADEEELNHFWVWPKDARPEIGHDHFDFDLPIIDLSPVLKLERLRQEANQLALTNQLSKRNSVEEEINECEAAKEGIQKAIRAACEEYGFFQIINHGMSMDVVEQFQQSCRNLFGLPLEVKRKVEFTYNRDFKPSTSGYHPINRSNAITKTGNSHIWNEGFEMESPEYHHPGRMEEIVRTLWPEDPPENGDRYDFKSRAAEYGRQSSSLTFILLDLIGASFGVPEPFKAFVGHGSERQIEARLRINHYPVCPEPEKTWGIHGHTDPDVLTILHQDEVGGLQIGFKDGSWHGVRPIPGAFVVNVGDFLQGSTNGRFISAQHRVVTSKAERYSFAYFAGTCVEHCSKPEPQTVDADHPLRYRPFTKRDYLQALQSVGLNSGKKSLLEKAFGIENSA